ncbi:glycosyltransferase [uncultured Limosilactobacillus sp.]|uniref:glycosyltransferase family 2 protein n=1 Tax=uncultured Limosilactobacillus sp. TaxID=2837629 RepID=UPI0025D673A5|nr:glycosyltransferase [uncultured Limosilactobacillus sp.]
MDKISVIVPIYNVASYLKQCLDSIVSQTYRNLEIVLVNDGSTDNSLQICQQYQEQDKRIRVISQKNAGVSAARNTGIEVSTGQYLTFVDPDDCYSTDNALDILSSLVNKNHVKIAVGNFDEFDESTDCIVMTTKPLFTLFKSGLPLNMPMIKTSVSAFQHHGEHFSIMISLTNSVSQLAKLMRMISPSGSYTCKFHQWHLSTRQSIFTATTALKVLPELPTQLSSFLYQQLSSG